MLSTNVNVEDFLAKNLQINIIRNSFDALGVLKEILITQRCRDAKFSIFLS